MEKVYCARQTQQKSLKSSSVIKITIAVMLSIVYCIFNDNWCQAANYYIDYSAGADNQSGSLSKPWKTLSKLYYTSILPGDTIYLKKGAVWNENFYILFSGTQTAPVNIRAYGSTGSMPQIKGLVFIYARDINIQNIEVVQSQMSGFVLDASYASRVTIKNCSLKNHAFSGIFITEGNGQDFILSNNNIQNNPVGIFSQNQGTEQHPTNIFDNNILSSESVGVIVHGSFHEIRSNTISGSSQIGIMIENNSRQTKTIKNDIRDTQTAGIWVSSTAASGHAILENNFIANSVGIYLDNDNPEDEKLNVLDNFIRGNEAGGIVAQGSGYFLASNTILQNGNSGIYIISPSIDITMMTNDISDNDYAGILISQGNYSGLKLTGNMVYENIGHGIAALGDSNEGEQTIILNNEVYDNGFDGILIQGDGHIVEYNRVQDNGAGTWPLYWGATGIHVYAENSEDEASHNLIRYNIVSGTMGNSNGSDGNGILVDEWCRNNIVHHNITNENHGPGFGVYGGSNNYFYNNIAYDNSVDVRPHLSRMEVIVASNTDPVSENNIFKNNIIQAIDAQVIPIIIDWNACYNNNEFGNNIIKKAQDGDLYYWNDHVGTTMSEWNLLSTGDGNDFSNDPEFVDAPAGNFKITASSFAIDQGVDLDISDDFFGNPIPSNNNPDIGIFEYQQ